MQLHTAQIEMQKRAKHLICISSLTKFISFINKILDAVFIDFFFLLNSPPKI